MKFIFDFLSIVFSDKIFNFFNILTLKFLFLEFEHDLLRKLKIPKEIVKTFLCFYLYCFFTLNFGYVLINKMRKSSMIELYGNDLLNVTLINGNFVLSDVISEKLSLFINELYHLPSLNIINIDNSFFL